MPTASWTHTIPVTSTPEAVWDRLNLPDTWLGIGPVEEVWDAAFDDAGHLASFSWRTSAGPRRIVGTAVVADTDALERMELHLDAGEIDGSLVTTIDTNGEEVVVLHVKLAVRSKGPLASLFFPVISDVLGRGLPVQMQQFAETLSH